MGLEAWIERQLHPERIDDRRARGPRSPPCHTLRLLDRRAPARATRSRARRKREIQKKRAEMGENASEDDDAARAARDGRASTRATMEGSPRQVVDELQQAKVLRAVYSERQLDEVLVDFWMNHFNVFASKGPERFLVGAYERDVIRPHAWGRFEDLLMATAKSPAMLFYLDNWLSADPERDASGSGDACGAPRHSAGARGLNENYAREIMELHTLGVDGGYTQKDVTEVARCFTGWTIAGLRAGRAARSPSTTPLHDRGDKVVLGHRIKGGGQRGRRAGHPPARHPSRDRALHLLQARPPLRGRRAAAGAGGPRRGDLPHARTATSARW